MDMSFWSAATSLSRSDDDVLALLFLCLHHASVCGGTAYYTCIYLESGGGEADPRGTFWKSWDTWRSGREGEDSIHRLGEEGMMHIRRNIKME
jgi:hypothetical protein